MSCLTDLEHLRKIGFTIVRTRIEDNDYELRAYREDLQINIPIEPNARFQYSDAVKKLCEWVLQFELEKPDSETTLPTLTEDEIDYLKTKYAVV